MKKGMGAVEILQWKDRLLENCGFVPAFVDPFSWTNQKRTRNLILVNHNLIEA